VDKNKAFQHAKDLLINKVLSEEALPQGYITRMSRIVKLVKKINKKGDSIEPPSMFFTITFIKD
jgi:hypothetical protein